MLVIRYMETIIFHFYFNFVQLIRVVRTIARNDDCSVGIVDPASELFCKSFAHVREANYVLIAEE